MTLPPKASASRRAEASAVSPAYSTSTPTVRMRPSAFLVSGGRWKSSGLGARDASCAMGSPGSSSDLNEPAQREFLAGEGARIIPIADSSDPRLEPYRALRERDLLGRQDRFIAEGEVVLRLLLGASRLPVESILLSQKRAAALADLLTA